jgi:hypothetical protein
MFEPTEDKPQKNYPIPAVVLPKEWSIIESTTPAVDILGGKMQVPLSDHGKDLAMRLHEMMHVKMSPQDKGSLKISKQMALPVAAFEDYRVNTVIAPIQLRQKGYTQRHRRASGEAEMLRDCENIPEDLRGESLVHFLEDAVAVARAERIPPESKALGVISAGSPVLTAYNECYDYHRDLEYHKSRNTAYPSFEEWWKTRDSGSAKSLKKYGIDPKPVYDAIKKVCRDCFPVSENSRNDMESTMILIMNYLANDMSFNNVMKQSRLWVRRFKAFQEQEEKEKKVQHDLASQANQTPGIGNEHQLKVQEGLEEMMSELCKDNGNKAKYRRGRPRFEKTTDISLSEALDGIDFEIQTLPLEIYKPSILSRKKRPEFIGAVPKHMERLPFDGQVFERKMRGLGGSVLIDNSGSMSLRDEELELLVKKAPAVTVGAYSGNRGGSKGTGYGQLTILAAHGRMADLKNLKYSGGLNIVDVQSLEWLAKQQPPRIWVSDGGVTGKDHDHFKCVVERCCVLCLQNGIIRVPSVEKALDLFANEAVFSERGRRLTKEKLRWQHEEGGGIL